MKKTKNMVISESVESNELFLFADNNSTVYFNSIVPWVKRLAKKYSKGMFDYDKAVFAFYYVSNYANELYKKEYGFSFNVTARFTCAAKLLENYMENIIENDI